MTCSAAAHRQAFEKALMETYGIAPADCVDLNTLDDEIAAAIGEAGGDTSAGVAALVAEIGEKYDLTSESA